MFEAEAMVEALNRYDARHPISRRAMLQLLAVGGAGLAATACAVSTQTAAPPQKVSAGDFQIPNSGAKLPAENVTLRWMDSGDQKAVFFKAFFPVYHDKHPNVTVQYDGTNWNAIQQVIILGVRNGTAPDVFQLPLSITPQQAVANKWVGSVDDIVPNWPEVKKRFPSGIFANGITDFGGKTYGVPFTGNNRIENLFLFNEDYMKKAGYDPSSKVLTWDELRAACKKCTQQGAGKYYGIITGIAQASQLSGIVDTLAEMAGAHGNQFNPLTGHYNFTSDQYIEATELLMAIKSDGSFLPGSTSLDAPGARGRFPQGDAAILFQGAWNIPAWKLTNPDFHLGLNLPPVKTDVASAFPISHKPGGSNIWYRSAVTKLGPVIGDIFNYLATVNGQTQWAEYDGAGDPSAFPQAITHAKLDPLSQRAFTIASKWAVIGPEPAVRNLKIGDVYLAEKLPTPSYSETIVGLFTGQLGSDVKAVMTKLQSSYERMLDDAIKLVNQREGTSITRDDFVFKNWNPRQSYPTS
jgi:multiple sugar transport system substrate-binding protein